MDIVVVGSINMDIVASVDRLPTAGETVTATSHFTNPGGKGANQAVAAARLGRSVAFIGCVGNDVAGEELSVALRADGVGVVDLAVTASLSGVALITVDSSGANTIVVGQGANADLTPELVEAARGSIAEARAVMVQLEIPLESVRAALTLAGGLKVLNPAPGARLDAELVGLADVVVPNETELGIMLGGEPPGDPTAAIEMARSLGGRVVVTLGANGAVFVDGAASGHVPSPSVDAVDTTAAGDAFCAALTDALLADASTAEAVAWAVRVGATTTTRYGAQASLPTRDEVVE